MTMAEAQLRHFFNKSPRGKRREEKPIEQDEPCSVLLTPEHTPVKEEEEGENITTTPGHIITMVPRVHQRKTRAKALHFKELNSQDKQASGEESAPSDSDDQSSTNNTRSLCRSNSDSILDSPKPTKAKLVRCEAKVTTQTTEVKTSTGRPPKPGKGGKGRKSSRKNLQCNGVQSSDSESSKQRSRSVPPKKKPAGANHLVTDYFPTRKSTRVPHSLLRKQEQRDVEEAILSRCEDGLEVVDLLGKGRGVVATKLFRKGDFVVEYYGDLITLTAAKKREQKYANNADIGCYMYYFAFGNKTYCIDATAESGRMGRLLNHSKSLANCSTRVVPINNRPYLIIVAARDVKVGEELLYDYGDRSKTSLESHPWLAS